MLSQQSTRHNDVCTFSRIISYIIYFFDRLGFSAFHFQRDSVAKMRLKAAIFYGCNANNIILIVLMALGIVAGFRHNQDIIIVSENIIYIAFLILNVVKIGKIISEKDGFTVVNDVLEQSFPNALAQQQHYGIDKKLRAFNLVMKLYMKLCFFGIIFFAGNDLLHLFYNFAMGRQFQRILSHFDVDAEQLSLAGYLLALANQVIGKTYLTVAGFICDVMCYALIFTHYLSFQMLAKDLNTMKMGGQSSYQQLCRIIERHDQILSLEKLLNRSLGLVNFFTYFALIFWLCFGFIVMIKTPDYIVVIRFALFVAITVLKTFLMCFLGDILEDSSEGVGDAAYNQDWTDCNTKYKNALLLVILRSQRTVSVQAILFSRINIELFKAIVSAAYQFFTIFYTMT